MSENVKTFWQFLKENTIEIPIIQRDYAQGRLDKGLSKEYLYIRKNFLNNIKQALNGKLLNREGTLKLDYVYGSTESDKLQPLDGQQRLTTLWLLHWYIAYKAGTLNDKIVDEQNNDKVDEQSKNTVKDRLKKFTYETRISSREFCEKLATFAIPQPDGVGIVEHIKAQTWFYSAWQQDPTIQSMLCMLGGTKINDKYGEDIIDGLEELFANTEQQTFKAYWKTLISEKEAPIIFYYLPLKDFGLSDDLYVKMNARGKQLTAFENFKADLIGYIEQEKAKQEAEWDKLSDIAMKMDTTWLDIFWKNKSDDKKVDEIYYAFINRFFWNALLSTKLEDEKAYLLAEEKETENVSYNYLTKDNYNDYNDLAPYKYRNNIIPLQVFEDLEIVLDRYSKFEDPIPCAKWIKDFEFIPKYKGIEKTTHLPQITSFSFIHRVLFFALYKYFKEGEADKESLAQWMRVVCNLASGKDKWGDTLINRIKEVREAIEYISKLNSHKVYESLCKQEVGKEDDDFNRLWTEEVYKAQQILNGDCSVLHSNNGALRKDDDNEYDSWEEVIIEAENFAFFNGGIRFLFCDDHNIPHWEQFGTKFSNAKKFFKKEDTNGSCLKDEHNNAKLLKILISKFDNENCKNWWENNLLYDHKIFNNNASTWRYYLMMPDIINIVHYFMLDGSATLTRREGSEDVDDNIIYLLSNTKLLDFVFKNMPDARIHWYSYSGCWALYPSRNTEHIVCLESTYTRNRFLENNNLAADNRIDKYLFYGVYIHFDYANKHFCWGMNDYVYLMEDENKYNYSFKNKTAQMDNDKYYRFFAKNKSDNEIITAMNDLIKDRDGYAE